MKAKDTAQASTKFICPKNPAVSGATTPTKGHIPNITPDDIPIFSLGVDLK